MAVGNSGEGRINQALLMAVGGARTSTAPADLALAIARTALAWIFIYHGGGKLFSWFHGPGIHQTSIYFSQTAHLHPGGLWAVVGGITELGGGIAMALGLFTRLAGIALFGDMVMAMITVTWANGIVSQTSGSGFELNIALGVLALTVGFFGAGRFSVDAALERQLSSNPLSPTHAPTSGEALAT